MSIHSESIDIESQELLEEKVENSPNTDNFHIINIGKKTCRRIRLEEILNPIAFSLSRQQYIILIHKPSENTFASIRKAYNLHPVIEYEYNNSLFTKDHMIKFDEYLFITLTDISESNLSFIPASLKVVLMKNIMFIFIDEMLYCIEEIFVKTMNFSLYFIKKSTEPSESEEANKKHHTALQNVKRRFTVRLDLVEFYELTDLEEILYKLLHVMFIRLEQVVIEMDHEVEVCHQFAIELSSSEKIDYTRRVQLAKRMLILATNYIDSKSFLLYEIISTGFLTDTFNQYLQSMALNMNKLMIKIDSSLSLLKSSECLYGSIVKGVLSDNSEKTNDLIKFFSALSVMCLPLYLIGGFLGMNVLIPAKSGVLDDSYDPFIRVCIVTAAYLTIGTIFFRHKRWL